MPFHKKKFSDEIHIGLLLIIIILILLNFITNYVLFYARGTSQEKTSAELSNICIEFQNDLKFYPRNEEDDLFIKEFKKKNSLSSLILLNDNPSIDSKEMKLQWIEKIIEQLPAGQIPELAEHILGSKYNTLSRGEDDEFFVSYSFNIRNQQKLLIISKEYKELAFLYDASNFILIASIIAILLLAVVYFKFYKFLMSPFVKIKNEAKLVGRMLDSNDDDIESILNEYQNIIKDLERQENELKLLNKQIKNRAENLEEYNKYLLDSMSSGMIMTDEKANIIKVNHSILKIMSLSSSDLIDRNILKSDHLTEPILDFIKAGFNEGEYKSYQEFELSVKKKLKFIGINISKIFNNESKLIGISLFINDLTELKILQQKLERNNQLAAMGEMSAGLAHQLRNSIGAISGYSNLIEKKLKKENRSLDIVTPIKEELFEAENLISKFLNFTKPFDANIELFNIRDLIDDWVKKYNIQHKPDNININLIFEELYSDEICLDQLLIKQAFYNILDNAAIAYNGEEGIINIIIFQSIERVHITISDFASGIAEKDLNRIFTPFYSSRPDGNGLGLPLAKRIAILHSGDIEVTSKLSYGTTFSIILPLNLSEQDIPGKKELLYQ